MCKKLIKNSQSFGKKFQKTVGGDFFDSHCGQSACTCRPKWVRCLMSCMVVQAVIPESATMQVKELFVQPDLVDATRNEAQSLPSLEISEVLSVHCWQTCWSRQCLVVRQTLGYYLHSFSLHKLVWKILCCLEWSLTFACCMPSECLVLTVTLGVCILIFMSVWIWVSFSL